MLNNAIKQDLDRLGRLVTLLLNRSMMYQVDHPYVSRALEEFHPLLTRVLRSIHPLVFAMNRDQFFVDDSQLDPQVNTKRILNHFKKNGVESISFYPEISKEDILKCIEVLFSPSKYPDAAAMKAVLVEQGIFKVKINHVVFRKVTEDDEVIPREELTELNPEKRKQSKENSKRLLMDMLVESVLVEELGQTLDLKSILKDPKGLSRDMVETDIRCSRSGDSNEQKPGFLLLHQLQAMGDGISQGISEGQGAGLADVAVAVFDMKRELLTQMAAREAEHIRYMNQKEIRDEANEITDMVLMRLLKSEYRGGNVSVQRLAQIIRRLIPDMNELRRELPKIKTTLLEAGMPPAEFLQLVQELDRELEGEELGTVLRAGSEAVGVQSKDIFEELKRDPGQAAALICLAAEMRKATSDENLLTDLLVNYVEGLGVNFMTNGSQQQGTTHVQEVIRKLETNILGKLKDMDVGADVLLRLEQKLDARLDVLLEEWRQSRFIPEEVESGNQSVMQILEQSVQEGDELGEILKVVRSRMEAQGIDENDFDRIYEEIAKQKRAKNYRGKAKMPAGVLRPQALKYLIQKEILRATRYGLPFSTVAFSIVYIRQKNGETLREANQKGVEHAILRRLSSLFRDVDIIGELGSNQLVALLPVTAQEDARIALRRSLKVFHAEPVRINGDSVEVKLAGIAKGFDGEETPDVHAYLSDLSDQLRHMTARIQNIQGFL